ncbi:MAG: DNA replication/repair protein RecF [Alistipes sp.]|nr:DNA replication/repair protein RecF [Alistipes sp.]
MRLKKLSLINFKNLAQQEIEFAPSINCFVGDNGTCKTNIVDAIHYLAMCKSALGMSDPQCVLHGEDNFIVDGAFENEVGRKEQIVCTYSRGNQKVIKRNGKAYERFSEHVGLIPTVIVSPADSMLISESAEERRKYINAFISQFDRDYLAAMIRYNSALAERNKYLKIGSDEQMLVIYDMQLAASAEKIYQRRKEMIERLQPVVAQYYKILSGDRETVSLAYRTDLEDAELTSLLLQSREKDCILGHTTVGIHRDEIIFTIGDVPLRKYGSQGQQKSFIIALKLAQYQIIAEQTGKTPILLLDDVFDKLDESRVAELIDIVASDSFGQIVITDCSHERMERLLKDSGADYKLFDVTYGKVLNDETH